MKKMLLLACAALLSVSAAFASEILITVAHGATEDHSSHIGWLEFKRVVEEKSNGELKVEIYPNQQMGGDREVTEAAQIGNVAMGHSSCSPVAGFAREFFIMDAPFMFNTRDEVYAALDGEPGKALLKCLEKINLKGLGFTENGFRNLTANKRITTPDDLKGIKIRVMENKVQMLTWSSLGANPTPIAFGELFTSLQQGTVDAQENPFELIYTNKFFEVQKYVVTTNHIYSPMPVFMNLEFYDDLSDAHKRIVEEAAREMITLQRTVAKDNEDKAVAAIKDKVEIVTLSPEQKKLFQDRMGPVYAEVRSQVKNDALVDMFLK